VVHDASTWICEHEWRQDLAVVTKWLSGMSPVCYTILYVHCGLFNMTIWMKDSEKPILHFFSWHSLGQSFNFTV
jgi:hypothetical protein